VKTSRLLGIAAVAALLLGVAGTASNVIADQISTSVEIDQFKDHGSLSQSRNVIGLLGGTIIVGRFTVIVPPGAIRGMATITATVPDRSQLLCELSISPASANQFNLPVTLIANGVGGTIKDSASLRMFWLEPSTGTWVPVGIGNSNLILIAQLRHFSTYAGGRGGW
jgi:hypothetical protein